MKCRKPEASSPAVTAIGRRWSWGPFLASQFVTPDQVCIAWQARTIYRHVLKQLYETIQTDDIPRDFVFQCTLTLWKTEWPINEGEACESRPAERWQIPDPDRTPPPRPHRRPVLLPWSPVRKTLTGRPLDWSLCRPPTQSWHPWKKNLFPYTRTNDLLVKAVQTHQVLCRILWCHFRLTRPCFFDINCFKIQSHEPENIDLHQTRVASSHDNSTAKFCVFFLHTSVMLFHR